MFPARGESKGSGGSGPLGLRSEAARGSVAPTGPISRAGIRRPQTCSVGPKCRGYCRDPGSGAALGARAGLVGALGGASAQ
eukprot:2018090-Alexandrium_andersonii.AAC.1